VAVFLGGGKNAKVEGIATKTDRASDPGRGFFQISQRQACQGRYSDVQAADPTFALVRGCLGAAACRQGGWKQLLVFSHTNPAQFSKTSDSRCARPIVTDDRKYSAAGTVGPSRDFSQIARDSIAGWGGKSRGPKSRLKKGRGDGQWTGTVDDSWGRPGWNRVSSVRSGKSRADFWEAKWAACCEKGAWTDLRAIDAFFARPFYSTTQYAG